VVTDLHKFDFRVVIKETRSKWRPVEGSACSDEKHIFDRIYVYPRPSYPVLRESTLTV